MKWNVLNQAGKEVDTIELDDDIFARKVHEYVLGETLKAYLANKRQGTAKTKQRSEIAKSNAKPWKQKGTGRARAGRASSPLWRGGGTIFGPIPRSYRKTISRKMKRLACVSALSLKVKDSELIILDKLDFANPDTKAAGMLLANIKASAKPLFVVKQGDENFIKSIRNIKKTFTKESKDVNAFDIASAGSVIFTKDGIVDLSNRLKKPIIRGSKKAVKE